MYAVVTVTVRDGLQRLPNDLLGEHFGTAIRVPFQFVEYRVLAVLEHQMEFPFASEHLQQIHQIRMFQRLKRPQIRIIHFNCSARTRTTVVAVGT